MKWKEKENEKFGLKRNIPHLPLNKGDEVLYNGKRYGFSKYVAHDLGVIHQLDGSRIDLAESIVSINKLIKIDKTPGEPYIKVSNMNQSYMIQYKEQAIFYYANFEQMQNALGTFSKLYNGAPIVCEDKHLRLKLVTSGFAIQNKSSL